MTITGWGLIGRVQPEFVPDDAMIEGMAFESDLGALDAPRIMPAGSTLECEKHRRAPSQSYCHRDDLPTGWLDGR